MPIEGIQLSNFKCFEDSGRVRLAPLTVIFGKNNAGKSSILNSLLLLRQTLVAPDLIPRLNIRGTLYSAGDYADIVYQHRASKNIVFSFSISGTYRNSEEKYSAKIELEFASDEPQPPRLASVRAYLEESENVPSLEIRRSRGQGGPYEMLMENHKLGGELKANFRFAVNRFLPRIGFEPPAVGRPNKHKPEIRRKVRDLFDELEKSLLNVRAVGAFRQQPGRRYEFQGRVTEGSDASGKDVILSLIEDTTGRRNRGALLRNVNRYLQSVGKVKLLRPRSISKQARLFEVRLKDTDSGRWANFADVGYGIGQALPVIVEGLRTPQGGTFLVQEPEIHLHPDAQLRMADFLVDLVKSGKRVIAETHSENLLLRIRHSIVKTTTMVSSGLTPDQVSIVYVDKSSKGPSKARELKIDSLGQIDGWPIGFMEEATTERISLLEDAAR